MKNRRGFTLIELMVVIAIVVILGALSFSAITGAVSKGQQTACLGNLKQLALALRIYAVDNNGFCPSQHNGPDGYLSWANVLSIGGYTPTGQTQELGPPTGPYVCPSQPNKTLKWGVANDGVGRAVSPEFSVNGGYYWFSTHYGLNSFFLDTYTYPNLGPQYYYPKQKLTMVVHTASVFLVGDISDNGGSRMAYLGISYPYMILRHAHNTECNMAFVDGHEEALNGNTVYPGTCWTDNNQ